MFNVFEQPWSLVGVAVVSLIVVLIIWKIRPAKRRWWQLAIPLVIGLFGVGLEHLVQTDPEKIKMVITKVVKSVEQEDCDAIDLLVSENYRDSRHSSKKSLMRHCRFVLTGPIIDKNIWRPVSIDIADSKAKVFLTVKVFLDKKGYASDFAKKMFTEVEMELEKGANKKWLISKVEIVSINRQPSNWKDITSFR